MAAVALIVHHLRDKATELAREAAGWLGERGHEVRLPTHDAEHVGLPDHGCTDDALPIGLDLAVALGGDGTMLRSVHLVSAHDVPVLGINVGHLGYLTETDSAGWRRALEQFFVGAYSLDERMLITVDLDAPSGAAAGIRPPLVLNEAVLEKVTMGHTVRLLVSIDGEFFTSYVADGLIVATPTGSTAYAFSARGPIVAPSHRTILLTPVSPHMLFDRTLVLDPTARVRLEVSGGRSATLSIDGQNVVTLDEGDAIVCTANPRPAHLVSFGGRNFHRILKSKFGLNDR
jgi:NAD+ kinase